MYVISTKDNFREAQLKASLHNLYFYELFSIIIVTLFYFCGECITYAQILHTGWFRRNLQYFGK